MKVSQEHYDVIENWANEIPESADPVLSTVQVSIFKCDVTLRVTLKAMSTITRLLTMEQMTIHKDMGMKFKGKRTFNELLTGMLQGDLQIDSDDMAIIIYACGVEDLKKNHMLVVTLADVKNEMEKAFEDSSVKDSDRFMNMIKACSNLLLFNSPQARKSLIAFRNEELEIEGKEEEEENGPLV